MAALASSPISSHLKFALKPSQLVSHLADQRNATTLLSRRYEQLLRSEKHFDCVFHIERTNVKCHKLILSAASPVFEAMFFGPIREEHQDIDILDISPDIFKVLIDYIYTGSVDFDRLILEQTVELYYSAEKYLLSELIDDCLLAIARKLRFSNILPALELSICMDLSGLLEVCMSFFTRCCLSDPQYMSYLKSHYQHVSKECIKSIIAVNKDLRQQLLWFVDEWCQQECKELGLQKSDCALIIDDLQLKEIGLLAKGSDQLSLVKLPQLPRQCSAIERSYYKASRPFTVDYDACEWKMVVKCDRFITLLGLVMHSRLTPNVAMCNAAHLTRALSFPSEYNESLRIEISALSNQAPARAIVAAHSDGEDESDQEAVMDQDDQEASSIIWQHSITKQPTKYNCDLNIRWDEGVFLSPDVDYQIKLIWQSEAYGSEYPCSLLSNAVDGIQFRDFDAHYGSLIKGLRFINLV